MEAKQKTKRKPKFKHSEWIQTNIRLLYAGALKYSKHYACKYGYTTKDEIGVDREFLDNTVSKAAIKFSQKFDKRKKVRPSTYFYLIINSIVSKDIHVYYRERIRFKTNFNKNRSHLDTDYEGETKAILLEGASTDTGPEQIHARETLSYALWNTDLALQDEVILDAVYIQGKPYKQVAKETGISVRGIQRSLASTKLKLRQTLEQMECSY